MELTLQKFNSPTLQQQKRNRGFTLVELIVVITIIASLLAVGVGTIKNVAGSKGVSTGVSLAEGVFDHARNLAKANGKARVLVYADEGGDNADKRERYLRLLAVSKLKIKDDPSDADEWILAGSGTSLPADTFFNANLCAGVQKITAVFPGSSTAKSCYVYEFNSEGALINPTTKGAFIMQSGRLLPGQTVPKNMPSRSRDVGGFAIWSTGKTSTFRSPDQIEDYTSKEIGF